MRRRGRSVAVLLLGLVLAPLSLRGQTPDDLLARGVQAYGDLDFNAAVGFLRRWLAADANRASREQLARGLTYLAAAEEFRGNRDSATAAFRRLVLADPRYHVDQMVFPPEITGLFATVRQRTKAVDLDVPDSVSLAPGETLSAWAYASSTHDIAVQVQRGDGQVLAHVYSGPIGDSLLLRWDGSDSTGVPLGSGSYFLTVRSMSEARQTLRILQVPFNLAAVAPDTLAHPPPPADSLMLPERRGWGTGLEALLGGLVTGVGATALPALMAPDASLSPARFVLGTGAGVVAIIGLATHGPGRLAANVEHNEAVRQAWRDAVADVSRENARRRAAARLRFHFGTATAVDLVRQ